MIPINLDVSLGRESRSAFLEYLVELQGIPLLVIRFPREEIQIGIIITKKKEAAENLHPYSSTEMKKKEEDCGPVRMPWAPSILRFLILL